MSTSFLTVKNFRNLDAKLFCKKHMKKKAHICAKKTKAQELSLNKSLNAHKNLLF